VAVEFDKGILISERIKLKTGYPGLKEATKLQAARVKMHALLIEDKQTGQGLIQELRNDTNLPVVAVQANVDKVARAWPCVPYWEAKRVFFPLGPDGEPEDWVEDFLNELYSFPKAKHDDQVDAFTQIINYLVVSRVGATGLLAWYKQQLEKDKQAGEAAKTEDAKLHPIDYVKLLGAK
jgi:predicted phage terminase large subunit-like protein